MVSDSIAETETSTVTGSEILVAGPQEALDRFQAASSAMIESLTRTQREIAEFVSERLKQDMETQAALMGCRDLDEFRDVQTRFLHTAIDQYADKASRLMRLTGEIMRSGMEPPAR